MNEELQQLSSSAHGLLEKEAGPAAFRQVRESDGPGFDVSLWGKMAELGWAGLALSEEHGGYDMGARGLVAVGEALGAHLASSPFATTVLAAKTLAAAGVTGALEEIVAGTHVVAVPLDAGSRRAGPTVMAVRSGDGFRLKGNLRQVANFPAAQSLLFWARTSDDATTAFIMPTADVKAALTVHVDMHRAASVAFEDLEVGADAVVGEVGGGDALLEAALDPTRAAVAAELVGLANAVFRNT
ncbi:MAG: acyl-CoA dehydrogenase family protein, partial [Myxococcota bacterium]